MKPARFIACKWAATVLAASVLITGFPGQAKAAKKEQVKQMIKDALPDEQWKIDPEFFDFILDISIDVVVMFLKNGFWKSAMKVLAR